MKIAEILNESSGNSYYEVTKPFEVWVHDTYVPTGEHVWSPGGTAKVHRMTYKKLKLLEDDEVHFLVGGMFFVLANRNGKTSVAEGVIAKPGEKGAFEKSYGDYVNPQIAAVKKLVESGHLESLSQKEKTTVKYRG